MYTTSHLGLAYYVISRSNTPDELHCANERSLAISVLNLKLKRLVFDQ